MTVRTNGRGSPPTQPEEAFRPFSTLSTGGAGLGLAIARDIARAQGGDIVLGDSVLGDSVLGDSVLGDSVLGDSVLGDSPLGDSPLGGLRERVRLPVS